MKISLACIAGNAEKYIGRFLDSFQPHFDEVVIVRAIGAQQADNTLRIAQDRGCVVGEYMNRPGVDWPHVDDFAAARNHSFDLATGDFVMWADMDDLLEGGDQIRAELGRMPDEAQAMSVLYDVRDDGIVVRRERIIRRGAARWIDPIHEQMDFKEVCKTTETSKFKIIHAPTGGRRSNDERNLRILESIQKPTGSQRFHKMMSLRAVGRVNEAIAEGCAILSDPPSDLGTAEIYESAFMVAQLMDDDDARAKMMLHALAIDPSRREAYGDLAMSYIAQGDGPKARALIQAMEALDMPNPRPWNLRPKYYGFVAPLLHGAALRACGLINQADTIERNHFIRNGAKISLIHATRGRAVKAARERWKWLDRAKNPDAIEHIFGLDIDDEQSAILSVHRHVLCRGNGGPVDAWNTAAAQARGDVLIQMSDDWDPPLHWDAAILERIGDPSKEAVLAVSDGHRDDGLLCMAIMTRARYKRQGFMFHPEFFSMYSDNWFSRQAYKDGVVIDCRDLTFEHIHPAFGKAEVDETYARSNHSEHYARGKAAFDRMAAGVKTSGDCGGWCDYRDFYHALAKALPDGGVFVEVGSWMGQSIILLAQELQNLGKKADLICVDTFKGEQNQAAHVAAVSNAGGSIRHIFEANIKAAQVDDMIRIVEGDSAESAALFADESIDGAFIDADHSYNGCKRDVEAWFPKVKADGIFCGHDYPWHEVKRAVDEHAAANGYQVGAIGRCWIKQQTKP